MIDLRQKVLECLRDDPETRNCDITLTIAIWKKFHSHHIKTGKTGEEGVWLKDLYSLPREDNVKRHRALIQNGHKRKGKVVPPMYPPTRREVVKQRKMNEERWLDFCRTVADDLPEYAENIT
tara:strand:- start:3982 stop:4347 length:366 start_codon:yes stop_codon:yes gene_type:complete